MRYFLCIILPPIAVLTTGKIGAFILNIILTCLGIIPGIIHAILVTNKYYADKRHKELLRATERTSQGGNQMGGGTARVSTPT